MYVSDVLTGGVQREEELRDLERATAATRSGGEEEERT